jgi:hypothetical protein
VEKSKMAAGKSLLHDIQAAETVDEQTLLGMLEQHEQALFIINLRMQAAQSASDAPRIEELNKDLETEKKYRAFFLKQLNDAFPGIKPSKSDFRDVEQQVVVNDYLQFLRLRRDAKLQYDAAKFTGNQTHADMAQMEVTRAMKYLAFYKPKFDRIARQKK